MTTGRPASAGGRSRREKGTGSITSYQTKAGRRWRYEIEVPVDPRRPDEGTRTVSRAGFTSHADAEDSLTLLRADTLRGVPQVISRDTFGAYGRRWLEGHPVGNGTRLYIQRVLDAMDPYIGSVRMADIRPTDLAAAYRGLENGTKQIPSRKRRQKGLAPSTVARYANWVNSIFLAAVDEGLIHRNPANSKHAGRPRGRSEGSIMGVCDVPVIHEVCNAAGDAAGAVITAPFDWLAQGMGGAAEWMFTSVWKVIDTTTYVDVTSGEYTKVYNIMFGVGVFVMLGFFMLQVIGGMIRREPAALSRAALGLAKSILGSFVALALLATALEITDQLCIGIVNAAGTNMNEMGDKVAVLAAGLGAINLSAPGAGAILTIFLASLAIIGAMVVWISLLIRKALLLIAIVFAPIALAGASWDHTRTWVSRWATFVIAMILSKVVLVVIFLLATAQVSAPIDADLESVSQPMAGVVLMLMAGFAPYLTYKAIAFMGFDMYHAMSAEQEAKSSLNRPMPIPLSRRTGSEPAKVLGGGGADGGGGTTSGATPAATGPSTGGPSGGTGGGGAGSGGAAGGTAAAGGAVAAGVVVAKEAAAAGPRLGNFVAAQATGQAQAHESAAPSTVPPPVGDSTLVDTAGKK